MADTAARCALALAVVGLWTMPAAAAPCDMPANAIVAENCLPGNPPAEWDVNGEGDASIQGFATDISVDRGGTISFKIDTDATAYRLDIYRMGYYDGLGARLVATVLPSVSLPQNQPACLDDPSTGLVDCGNWAVSATWAVPPTATSGIYFAKLVREDPEDGRASHIIFIVRHDGGGSDLLFQTGDTTWQAYNRYGGNSLYTGAPDGRAYKVSYNRPFTSRGPTPEDWVFNAEYPMVRWLEANGYDVSYFTGVDAERSGAEILAHRVYMSVGHDEYWSGGQRHNVEAAGDAGVHLAFFSGNEVFWKTRWESSIDGSATPCRTLVSYKETHANAKIDPLPTVWTGTWRDPRFSPPADGGRPENALSGTIFTVNCCSYAITVPAADGQMRFWRNTSIATLPPAATATLSDNTLGYEWDEDLDNGFRPAGEIRLSSTAVSVPERILDYGSTYGPGTATHHLTLHRRPSGALVFAAGTVQWSWGLDGEHDRGGSIADVRMQQATVNLFADMGVQPTTLQSGLVVASASTDTSAPASIVVSPSNGATVTVGQSVTISGTATDSGGGVVGGVEVSVDGGTTWHPANGRTSWSYTWVPDVTGTTAIRSRAADDSGNLSNPSAPVSLTVAPLPCPCSIWSDAVVPGSIANDAQAVELGAKFRSDVDLFVTGIRFYKGTLNAGSHVGHLWTAAGALLATASFTGESASGWQTVTLAPPVAIAADATYVVSYHTTVGNYAFDLNYFALAGVDNPPLHALRDGEDGPNGVYNYGPPGVFPAQTFNASNYWVDVVVETAATPTTTPTVTPVPPTPTRTGTATPVPPTLTRTPTVTPVPATLTLTPTVTAVAPALTATPSVTPGLCGNGNVDPGEQCDDGNTVNGDCCNSTCHFEPAGTSCNDHNTCTTGETCNAIGVCRGFTSCNTAFTCNICGSKCTLQSGVCKCG